jgi:hypothetical protein
MMLPPSASVASASITWTTWGLNEKIFNLKLSGNDVYYTNIMSKDHAV